MNTIKQIITKISSLDSKLILIFCLFYGFVGSVVSVLRYWQYEVFYYDFGIFDQAIWQVSRFKSPIVQNLALGKSIIFADHFSPSIFLYSPLYWFTNRSEILLIAQAVTVGLSGLFIYLTAKQLIKDKLVSFSILILYFLFVGLQNAIIFDFHELTVMTLPLSLVFYFIVKKNIRLFLLSLIVMLGFKETTFLVGIGIAIVIFFYNKNWRKISILTLGISLFWGVISIKLLIPHFSHGTYLYSPNIPNSIQDKLLSFFNFPEKRRTLLFSFSSFSFMPLLSPSFYALIIQDYATRFMPLNFVTRWGLTFHYNSLSAVILTLSSAFGFRKLLNFKIIKKLRIVIVLVIILNAVILNRFVLNGPLNLFYNKTFYNHTKDLKFLDNLVGKIPKNKSITTQNNLAVRFDHQDVMILHSNYYDSKPDYILMDLRPGQGANNLYGTSDVEKILKNINKDPNYEIFYKTDYQYIFQRKH